MNKDRNTYIVDTYYEVYHLKLSCHFQFVPFDEFTSSWILPLRHRALKRQ